MYRRRAVADDVQLLHFSELKPSTWKIKSRTRQRWKLEDSAIEVAAAFDIRHLNSDVIKLFEFHRVEPDAVSLGGGEREQFVIAWAEVILAPPARIRHSSVIAEVGEPGGFQCGAT